MSRNLGTKKIKSNSTHSLYKCLGANGFNLKEDSRYLCEECMEWVIVKRIIDEFPPIRAVNPIYRNVEYYL